MRIAPRPRWLVPIVCLLTGLVSGAAVALGVEARTQSVSEGRLYTAPSGTTLRLLLDEETLGGAEVDVGEITFPPGVDSGDHPHGSVEIFYVLSGTLEHFVNGERHVLTPGSVGFVRPPDLVRHRVDPSGPPAKALVIWTPGGEAARVAGRWKETP